jgi:hypothetical protein
MELQMVKRRRKINSSSSSSRRMTRRRRKKTVRNQKTTETRSACRNIENKDAGTINYPKKF